MGLLRVYLGLFRVYMGLFRVYLGLLIGLYGVIWGIMEKNMETISLGFGGLGWRVLGCAEISGARFSCHSSTELVSESFELLQTVEGLVARLRGYIYKILARQFQYMVVLRMLVRCGVPCMILPFNGWRAQWLCKLHIWGHGGCSGPRKSEEGVRLYRGYVGDVLGNGKERQRRWKLLFRGYGLGFSGNLGIGRFASGS